MNRRIVNRSIDDEDIDRHFVRRRTYDTMVDMERPAGIDALRGMERGNDLHDGPPTDTDWSRISAPAQPRNVRMVEVDVEWRNKDRIDNEIVCTDIDGKDEAIRRCNVLPFDTNPVGRSRDDIGYIPNEDEDNDRRFLPICIRIRAEAWIACISGKRLFHRNNYCILLNVRNYFHRHRNRNNRIRRIGRTSRYKPIDDYVCGIDRNRFFVDNNRDRVVDNERPPNRTSRKSIRRSKTK